MSRPHLDVVVDEPALERWITPRRASHLLALPWMVLRKELERRGAQLIRIAGRERVRERDVREMIRDGRSLGPSELKTRAQIIGAMAEARVFGEAGKPRRGGRRAAP